MRVLMVHNDYMVAGGETESTHAEVSALRDLGVSVDLLVLSNDSVAASGKGRQIQTILLQKDGRSALDEALRDVRPDIVHLQNIFPLFGGGGLRSLQRAGIPYVRSLRNYRKRCISGDMFRDGQNCYECSSAGSAWRGIRHGCYRGGAASSLGAVAYALGESTAERHYPPRAYIAVSDAVLRYLDHTLVEGVTRRVKPNTLATDPGLPVGPRPDRVTTLYVGRLEREKGIETVLNLASAVGWPVEIIGDGSFAGDVDRLSKSRPNVVWHRRKSNSEVLDSMNQARSVIIPSRWEEPFGRVAVEALACGAVPLVSDVGGLAEIGSALAPECVIDPLNITRWEEALISLHGDDSKFVDLSARAVEVFCENFSRRANAKMLVDIYEDSLRLP